MQRFSGVVKHFLFNDIIYLVIEIRLSLCYNGEKKEVYMGIFNKLKNRIKDSGILPKQKKVEKQDEIFPEFSLLDLLDANWRSFGCRLMIKNVLPANFSQNPSSVKVGVSDDKKPYAEVTYKDRRTGEMMTYKIYQNFATIVNKTGLEVSNEVLEEVWREFRRYLSASAVIKKQEDLQHHRMLESDYNQQQETKIAPLDLKNFEKREEQFLLKYKDIEFDSFGLYNDIGLFAGCEVDSFGGVKNFTIAKPFSPRTLEFCVNHLSKEAKNKEYEDEDKFKLKCTDVAIKSSYLSRDWERLTNILFEVLKGQSKKEVTRKKKVDESSILCESEKEN